MPLARPTDTESRSFTESRPFTASKPLDSPIPLHRRSPHSSLATVEILEQLAEQVLYLTPVPHLNRIWGDFQYIWKDHVQRARTSRGQLSALARSIAQLLRILNEQYRSVNIKESDRVLLDSIHGLVTELILAWTSDAIYPA